VTPPAITARAMAAAVRGGADPGAWARVAADRAAANPWNAFRPFHREAVEAQVQGLNRAGRLAGVPVVLKDNLADEGQPCGCASRALEGYLAPYSATCVARLRAEGAVVVGRSNMDEFAMGSSTENSAYGPARNPLDERRVPGGSSGGSAAAVAGGVVPIALGSETGGSVRQPASFCGIVGFKPTYGRISRHGLVAFASSLDIVSPFALDTRDAALLAEVMAGHDPLDSTSLREPVGDWEGACDGVVSGLRVGVLAEGEGEGVEPGVAARVAEAVESLSRQGAVVSRVSIPAMRLALAAYYVIAPGEASSNLARFDGVRYGSRAAASTLAELYLHGRGQGLGPEVQRRILLGTFALSAGWAEEYYVRAQRARARITADMEAALREVDVLVSPTSPTVAFKIGDRALDPLAMYLADILTVPASLAGLPAISVPCGQSEGLPVGLQITGRRNDEATVLRVASAVG